MNTTKTSLLRALCAVVVGALLIKYREQTVQWMTVAIGGLFLLSGVISCIVYFNALMRLFFNRDSIPIVTMLPYKFKDSKRLNEQKKR